MVRQDWMKWMLPFPRGLALNGADVPIDAAARVEVSPDAGERVRNAARQLRDDIEAWRGIALPIVPPGSGGPGSVIAIGEDGYWHLLDNSGQRQRQRSFCCLPESDRQNPGCLQG